MTKQTKNRRRALGKGLKSLIPTEPDIMDQSENDTNHKGEVIHLIPSNKIVPNPYQPRTVFDDEEIEHPHIVSHFFRGKGSSQHGIGNRKDAGPGNPHPNHGEEQPVRVGDEIDRNQSDSAQGKGEQVGDFPAGHFGQDREQERDKGSHPIVDCK